MDDSVVVVGDDDDDDEGTLKILKMWTPEKTCCNYPKI